MTKILIDIFALMTKGATIITLFREGEFAGNYSTLKGCVDYYREQDAGFPSYSKISKLARKVKDKGKTHVHFTDRNKVKYLVLFNEVL